MKRIKGENKSKSKSNKPSLFIIKLIKKCQNYKIDYHLMKRLNYNDLLAMVIEYDIEKVNEILRNKEKNRQSNLGIEKVEASNDDILKLHSKGSR